MKLSRLIFVLCLCFSGVVFAQNETKPYAIEVGYYGHYTSNLFQSVAGAPKTNSFINTISVRFETRFLQTRDSNVFFAVQAARNAYTDVDEADSSDFQIAGGYRGKQDYVRLTYFNTPERLSFLTPSGSEHNGVQGIDIMYDRDLTSDVSLRGVYRFSNEDYDFFDTRDADHHEMRGEVRFKVNSWFVPGAGFEFENVSAEAEDFSREEKTFVALLASRIHRHASVNLRFRHNIRDYTTEFIGSSNFDRQDTRNDFRAYANVDVADHWRVFLYGAYIDNDSTRLTRSFTAHEIGAGLFYRFE